MIKLRKLTREELENEHLSVIRELGRHVGVKSPASMKKEDIIEDILLIQNGEKRAVFNVKRGAPIKIKVDISKFKFGDTDTFDEKPIRNIAELHDSKPKTTELFTMTGVLETHKEGFGFLRANNYENSSDDVYVSSYNIHKFKLRRGDKVKAKAKHACAFDAAPALQDVLEINDMDPKLFLKRADFDSLLPYYPTQRIHLERQEENELALRCIDLFAPIGLGQRGLIVAPPKTGKTTLLKMIAKSIEQNCKDVTLVVLLIDERPEEVTDFKRNIKSEVVFSTFDESPEHHVKTAELVINRAKRLVEIGKNIVILMDSITRLARAYNTVVESSGKTFG